MDLNNISALDAVVTPPRAVISEQVLAMLKSAAVEGTYTIDDAVGVLLVGIMQLEVRVMELEGDTTVRREWNDLYE